MRRRVQAFVVVTGALALAACATIRGEPDRLQVDESQLVNLSPEQLEGVDSARQTVSQMQNELRSAEQAFEEAQERYEMARADREVSEAEAGRAKSRAEAEVEEGQDVEEHPQVQRTRERLEADRARERYLEEMVSVSEAERNEAEQQLRLAQAELERAKFTALQQGDPQAAGQIDARAPDFEREVAQARSQVAESQAQIADRRSEALDLYDEWVELEQQVRPSDRRAVAPEEQPTTTQ